MVSLRIGLLRDPRTIFRRKTSKQVACCKTKVDFNNLSETERTHTTEENLSQSSTDQSTDDSMDDCDIDTPIHISIERSPSDGSFKVCDSVRELIQRRTSSDYVSTKRSSTSRPHVTFLDEELGLTPRHVVTDVHYRPRTKIEERRTLYYCSKDFILFEKEHMYEKIEAEIQAIERQKRREQGDLSDVSDDEADKEPLDHLEVQKLIHRVRTRFNLELV